MKILVDMNLSPAWITVLRDAGHEAIHWSTIGQSEAPDKKILAWAQDPTDMWFSHMILILAPCTNNFFINSLASTTDPKQPLNDSHHEVFCGTGQVARRFFGYEYSATITFVHLSVSRCLTEMSTIRLKGAWFCRRLTLRCGK